MSPNKVIDDEMEEALGDFLTTFELVFHDDWEFSKLCLQDPEIYLPSTFLEPGVEDESNNWNNRGALLASYRRLAELLRQRGIDRR